MMSAIRKPDLAKAQHLKAANEGPQATAVPRAPGSQSEEGDTMDADEPNTQENKKAHATPSPFARSHKEPSSSDINSSCLALSSFATVLPDESESDFATQHLRCLQLAVGGLQGRHGS